MVKSKSTESSVLVHTDNYSLTALVLETSVGTYVLLASPLVRYLGADDAHKDAYLVTALVDLVSGPVDALQGCFGDHI